MQKGYVWLRSQAKPDGGIYTRGLHMTQFRCQ